MDTVDFFVRRECAACGTLHLRDAVRCRHCGLPFYLEVVGGLRRG